MNKSALRLLILAQVFCLFFLMLMPTLVRVLNEMWGKVLYGTLVVGAILFALALRYAFGKLE